MKDPIHQDLIKVIEEIRAGQEPEVQDGHRTLAEAACKAASVELTPEQLHVWATQLGASIIEETP